ncbi:hypothetical protein [Nocardioides alcanivorans]|uniref:hypothetical protein n=1 Tax=Nocardioides alcanivorans TaxID=2897352 RepID=UPI001F3BA7BC|nr:hypothetical protein [Nocardioides alcanivorans]
MVIGSAIISFWLAAGLLFVWWITTALYKQLREPLRVYDPEEALRGRTETWGREPVDVATWFGTPRVGDFEPAHVVGEIVRRTGGEDSHEDGSTTGVLVLRLPDSPAAIPVPIDIGRPDNARVGALVPVRREEDGDFEIAQNLSEDETRRVLLEHRVSLGVMDLPTAAALTLPGRAAVVEPQEVRPTGRVHRGHVEIRARFRDREQVEHEVAGFLRPAELALVRRTAKLPVALDPDGIWRLGTGWY